MTVIRAALRVAQKDLLVEGQTRARSSATVFFALLTLLLFAFAMGPEPLLLRRVAGGFLWLSMLLASVLNMTEAFRTETESGALEGLLLLPADPKAIFLGKALANAGTLLVLGMILVPVSMGLYGVSPAGPLPHLLGVVALGAFAIAGPGTLYGALATQVRGRDALFPMLLFPVLVPCLVAAVKATDLVLRGDAMGQFGGWVGLLAAFCAVYWVLGALLFGFVVDRV